jgi:hypothetical protein
VPTSSVLGIFGGRTFFNRTNLDKCRSQGEHSMKGDKKCVSRYQKRYLAYKVVTGIRLCISVKPFKCIFFLLKPGDMHRIIRVRSDIWPNVINARIRKTDRVKTRNAKHTYIEPVLVPALLPFYGIVVLRCKHSTHLCIYN